MRDESRSASIRNIRRVAAALGIEVEDLFVMGDRSHPSAGEVTDLLAAFSVVRDPEVRRRCIALVKGASEVPVTDAEAAKR